MAYHDKHAGLYNAADTFQTNRNKMLPIFLIHITVKLNMTFLIIGN